MKPITCSDVEPILIEYYSSADDTDLADSNQHVPQLILTHLQSCESCAQQFQGFSGSLQQPAMTQPSEAALQPVSHLVQYIDDQVSHFRQLINSDNETAEVDASCQQSTEPAWKRWIKSLNLPGMTLSPQAGYAMFATAALLLLVVFLWQPTTLQFDQGVVAFQAKLDITPQSVEYVYSMKRNGEHKPWMAFSSSRNKINPFLIGNLYSESVALYLQQDIQASLDHLELFADYLKKYPQLKYSSGYIDKLRAKFSQQETSALTKQQALAMFAAFPKIYKNEVAQLSPEQTVMFEFGAWVVNLNLAAVAHYPQLKNENSNLMYFNEKVKSVGLPSGIMKSLQQIGKLLSSNSLSDEDYQKIFKQGMNLKNQLG